MRTCSAKQIRAYLLHASVSPYVRPIRTKISAWPPGVGPLTGKGQTREVHTEAIPPVHGSVAVVRDINMNGHEDRLTTAMLTVRDASVTSKEAKATLTRVVLSEGAVHSFICRSEEESESRHPFTETPISHEEARLSHTTSQVSKGLFGQATVFIGLLGLANAITVCIFLCWLPYLPV